VQWLDIVVADLQPIPPTEWACRSAPVAVISLVGSSEWSLENSRKRGVSYRYLA
jgi:hypothetical protein